MEISEIANKAADIIERDGWTQFALYDGATGGYCARGAMSVALGGLEKNCASTLFLDDDQIEKFRKVDTALSKFVDGNVPDWNNAPERTKEEVVQAFRDLAIKHSTDAYTEGK